MVGSDNLKHQFIHKQAKWKILRHSAYASNVTGTQKNLSGEMVLFTFTELLLLLLHFNNIYVFLL